MGDARTVNAPSARVLLLVCLLLGGDVDWRSSLFSSGCTARLGAGNGQGTLTHFRTFLFDVRLLFGERDDFSFPLNDLLGTIFLCLIVKLGIEITICSLSLFLSVPDLLFICL